MVDYDSHAGEFNGSDNDLKLTTMPYAAIDGNFSGIRKGDSDYGQSVGEQYENTALVDGALYQRKDDESKVKLYSWDSLGFDAEDEEFKPAEFKRKNENYGGNTYNYTLIAARIDETGEVWVAENADGEPVMELNESDLPALGNVIIWNGGSSGNGPNSTAKTAARTLTNLGRDAIVDEDDVYNWLNSNAEIRSELEGKRIRRFKIEREGDEYSFYTPVYLDEATGNRIGIPNDTDTGSSGGGKAAATDGGTATESGGASKSAMAQAADKATGDESDFPPAIDDCIDYCVEQDITDADDVMGTFNVMANNPESSISLEMVEEVGQDTIVEAIEART